MVSRSEKRPTQRSVGDRLTVGCASEICVRQPPSRCTARLVHSRERSDRCVFGTRADFRTVRPLAAACRTRQIASQWSSLRQNARKPSVAPFVRVRLARAGTVRPFRFTSERRDQQRSDRSVAPAETRKSRLAPFQRLKNARQGTVRPLPLVRFLVSQRSDRSVEGTRRVLNDVLHRGACRFSKWD